jgi:hypothetical protein
MDRRAKVKVKAEDMIVERKNLFVCFVIVRMGCKKVQELWIGKVYRTPPDAFFLHLFGLKMEDRRKNASNLQALGLCV